MESLREKRRSTLYKSIAVAMTLIFHVALFGGIHYLMDVSGEQVEQVEKEKSAAQETKKQARS